VGSRVGRHRRRCHGGASVSVGDARSSILDAAEGVWVFVVLAAWRGIYGGVDGRCTAVKKRANEDNEAKKERRRGEKLQIYV
jgi:hypothetical protein